MKNTELPSARQILGVSLFLIFIPIILTTALFPEWYQANEFLADNLVFSISYCLIKIVVGLIVCKRGLRPGIWPGQAPCARTVLLYLFLSIPVVCLSILCIFLLGQSGFPNA